ncbi:hypothetical protein KUTeg_021857 [Tegillarca granosa]|uniref:Band 7 domain-containing protein n=1 Tax=Tegillarca granosa TaxID=220873 RepID=A0ABQ9E4K8_TEGGR|nr:hypothetical protein KUTeg_021857 [Tegillarca granosa]
MLILVKGDQDDHDGGLGCCGCVLMGLSIFIILIFFPFSLCFSIKVVQEYERAVIFRLGRVLSGGAKGPGDSAVTRALLRRDTSDIIWLTYPNNILTKDSVTVSVDAVVYARVFDATLSVCNVEDAFKSTKLLAATTLRNILGTKIMSELVTDRDVISESMQFF